MPRLYVGKIGNDVGRRDIEDFFKGYGKIDEIMMKAGYAFVDICGSRDAEDAVHDLNGRNLFGDRVSIEFAKGSERGVGGRPLCEGGRRREDDRRDRDRDYRRDRRDSDRRDRYRRSRSRSRSRSPRQRKHAESKYGPPVLTQWRMRVENLSSSVSWQDLKDYVRPHGEVTYADAHLTEKGVALLCFASQNDKDRAFKKLDGTEISGKKITMIDETDENRSRSPSRDRSRSRSQSRHSRSRSRSR